MNNAQELKEKIQWLLKEKGIKTSDMVKDLDLNYSFISDIGRRNSLPTADRLAKIATYLNVSIDYLLGIEKPIKNENTIVGNNINNAIVGNNINNTGNVSLNSKEASQKQDIELSEQEQELLKEFKKLDFKSRTKVLVYIYELEETLESARR